MDLGRNVKSLSLKNAENIDFCNVRFTFREKINMFSSFGKLSFLTMVYKNQQIGGIKNEKNRSEGF